MLRFQNFAAGSVKKKLRSMLFFETVHRADFME